MIGRDLLSGFEPSARRWLKVLFFGGVGFLAICVGLDVFSFGCWAKWWHGLGYTLNIFAALTGFLIGVPVTVVLLDRFKSNLAEKAQIDSVDRISKTAWEDFSKAIAEFCSDERVQAVGPSNGGTSATSQVQDEHDIIMDRLEACRDAIRRDANSTLNEVGNLKEFLATRSPMLEAKRQALDRQFGTRYSLRPKWNYIISLWRVLDEHVRLRRMEVNLPRMEERSYIDIHDKLSSDDQNGLFEFLDVNRGGKLGRDGGVTSMLDLQIIVDLCLEMPDGQLANILANGYEEWIGPGLRRYWADATSAWIFITSLKMAVESVTRSGWPKK